MPVQSQHASSTLRFSAGRTCKCGHLALSHMWWNAVLVVQDLMQRLATPVAHAMSLPEPEFSGRWCGGEYPN